MLFPRLLLLMMLLSTIILEASSKIHSLIERDKRYLTKQISICNRSSKPDSNKYITSTMKLMLNMSFPCDFSFAMCCALQLQTDYS